MKIVNTLRNREDMGKIDIDHIMWDSSIGFNLNAGRRRKTMEKGVSTSIGM